MSVSLLSRFGTCERFHLRRRASSHTKTELESCIRSTAANNCTLMLVTLLEIRVVCPCVKLGVSKELRLKIRSDQGKRGP